MECVECGVWSRVWSVECVKCGVWSMGEECGVWSVGEESVECGVGVRELMKNQQSSPDR